MDGTSVEEQAGPCREHLDAARTLLAAQPGGFLQARARLHLAGLEAGLRMLSPEARAAQLEALAAPVRQALSDGALPTADDALLALEVAHERLLNLLEQDLTRVRRRVERRWVLAGAAALALAAGGVGAVRLWSWWRAPPDLARGKPWSTSSSAGTCQPDEGRCAGERTRVLFYTREEQRPWFQVDLGEPRPFSSVTVRNRGDALLERAIPLVLEVSDDGAGWREVARKPDAFARWEARFAPVTARYLRARVDRLSVLHLEGVEIHP